MNKKTFMMMFLLSLLLPGCGNKKCTQDTDCRLPEICLNGSCVNIYVLDGTMDQPVEIDTPIEDQDVQETDQITPDIVDMPSDEGGEEEPGTCSPSLSEVRPIFGETTDSGADEHPEVITLPDGSFYLLGRKINAGVPALRLTAVKIINSGTTGSQPVDLFGTDFELPEYHHFVTVGDNLGVLFKDEAGVAENKILFITLDLGVMPPRPSTAFPLQPTDENSFTANGIDNDSNIFVVWKQQDPEATGGMGSIQGCFVEYDGSSPATASTIAGSADPLPLGEPVIAYYATGASYLMACFYHHDPADPMDQDKVWLVELDASGSPSGETEEIAPFVNGNLVVGRPAVVWAGDRWAVLWQEAYADSGADSHIHLTTKVPDNVARDTIINDQWSSAITVFSDAQTGELDMVWTGRELGIVLKHDGGSAGKKIYFAEFENTGTIKGSVLQVSMSGAPSSFFPSITYMDSAVDRYYLFAWLQYVAPGNYLINDATFGCTNNE